MFVAEELDVHGCSKSVVVLDAWVFDLDGLGVPNKPRRYTGGGDPREESGRANHGQRWCCRASVDDEDITTTVTPTAPTVTYMGPITRARACQLNYQVLSFLGNPSNVHEHMMLPKLDTFVLLTNEGPSMDKKDEHWSMIKHGDDGTREGDKNGISSEDFRTLKPP